MKTPDCYPVRSGPGDAHSAPFCSSRCISRCTCVLNDTTLDHNLQVSRALYNGITLLCPKSEADNGDLKSEADDRSGYKAPPEAGKWEHKETQEHSNQDPSPESTDRSPGKGFTRDPKTPPAEKAKRLLWTRIRVKGRRSANRVQINLIRICLYTKAPGWSQINATNQP